MPNTKGQETDEIRPEELCTEYAKEKVITFHVGTQNKSGEDHTCRVPKEITDVGKERK